MLDNEKDLAVLKHTYLGKKNTVQANLLKIAHVQISAFH